MTQTVVSSGDMRLLAGMLVWLGKARRFVTVVFVGAFRFTRALSAWDSVLTDQRSTPHWPRRLEGNNSRVAIMGERQRRKLKKSRFLLAVILTFGQPAI